jgi:hypothetical protein
VKRGANENRINQKCDNGSKNFTNWEKWYMITNGSMLQIQRGEYEI